MPEEGSLVNSGSPIGPGFVVYERAPGQKGYDLELAQASVGKGWHGLLAMIFRFVTQERPEAKPEFFVIQVKEKLGVLRVYCAGGTDWDQGFVDGLCTASALICEDCGAPGRLRDRRDGFVWIRTLCDEHAQAERARR